MVLIALGFAMNYFGVRIYKLLVAATGFVVFTLAGYIILLNWHLNVASFGKNFDYIIMGGSPAFGVLGALMAQCLWKWYLIALGALAGGSLATLVLFAVTESIPYAWLWLRTAVIAVMALIGGVAAYRFERPIVIVSTAVVGSLLLFIGIDVFAGTGFDALLMNLMSNTAGPNFFKFAPFNDQRVYGMIAACLGSALIGVAIQAKAFGTRRVRRQQMK